MTITAKYPARCAACGQHIDAGEQIEWVRGSPARHATCSSPGPTPVIAAGPTPVIAAKDRTITVSREGRRSYLRGDTLAVRGYLRAQGCHWDADARAWWIGATAAAERIAAEAREQPSEAAPPRRITHCEVCGTTLDDYQQRRGYRRCRDCVDGGGNAQGGQSYYDRRGNFVLGDDD